MLLDFLAPENHVVPLQEQYNSLTNKTLAFLKLVTTAYDPQFIVKADDDVYLRVDRLPYAVKQWTAIKSGVSVIWHCCNSTAFAT